MRTQSPDTSPEAERKQIERIRQAPVARRFRLVQSLSQRMLSGQNPEQEPRAQAIHAITAGYGQRLGELVRVGLLALPGWQEQAVDLTATFLPVMQALQQDGIPSYVGGSIASSLSGMQQSASDIDLVLIGQGRDCFPMHSALAALQDAYLIEPDVLACGLRTGSSCSLIHIGTLMKIDLIVPQGTLFDKAMQDCLPSLQIDERYPPVRVASALEMVVWKLARCAYNISSNDGLIHDGEWNDLLGMLKVQGTALDLAQLTHWTQFLCAEELLPQALEDAGLMVDQRTSPQVLAR